MSHFCCPVCRQPLQDGETFVRCANGHLFDRARYGYINLLRSQQSSSKRHGDDKRMLIARREFLDRGYYAPLRDALCEAVDAVTDGGLLLDAGCGEGYYTCELAERFPALSVCGIDISKDALRYAHARSERIETAVASAFSLPVADGAADAVISVFAPTAETEFARVLKSNGHLIRVVPTERHLFGLKAAIYKDVRLNKPERTELDGFSLLSRRELHDTVTITDSSDIRHLFEMTPYYYKTGQSDQQRLLALASLTTELGFAILTYRKI